MKKNGNINILPLVNGRNVLIKCLLVNKHQGLGMGLDGRMGKSLGLSTCDFQAGSDVSSLHIVVMCESDDLR